MTDSATDLQYAHTVAAQGREAYFLSTGACPACGKWNAEIDVVFVDEMGAPARTIHALRRCSSNYHDDITEVLQTDPENPRIRTVNECDCGAQYHMPAGVRCLSDGYSPDMSIRKPLPNTYGLTLPRNTVVRVKGNEHADEKVWQVDIVHHVDARSPEAQVNTTYLRGQEFNGLFM